ncbi:MAG TPA: FKBP-type peptidyl-prolyl cis-trans isomerase [Solirubrobacterales bacterium]|nr:FKBP-type peptidyl-prolyl cis-trans isomerase [Solirubrobacterales bacterium]
MQRFFLIILACLAVGVTGCGGDSSSSPTPLEEREAIEAREAREEKKEEREDAAQLKKEEEEAPDLPEPEIPSGPPPKKLVIEDLKTGSGATAKAGKEVGVEYVGVLYKTGEVFDANWEGEEPFTFTLGAQEVIKGWDQGLEGMKVGGERQLIIPPNLAYGPEAIFPSIPAYSTLVFLVRLVDVK